MKNNETMSLSDWLKSTGAILAVLISFSTVINLILDDWLIAIGVAIIFAIGISIGLLVTGKAQFISIALAWVIFAVILLIINTISPKTIPVIGTVTDSNGSPIIDENVELKDVNGGQYYQITDTNGAFKFPNVPIGIYKITVLDVVIHDKAIWWNKWSPAENSISIPDPLIHSTPVSDQTFEATFVSATETAIASATETAIVSATETAIASATETAIASATETEIASATETAIVSATETAIASATEAVNASATETANVLTTEDATLDTETVKLIVNQNSNVRSGPGTNYKIINTAQTGDTVEIIGKLEDESWWLINYKDQESWIHNSLVDIIGSIEGIPTVTPPPMPTSNTLWIDNFDDCNNLNMTGGENGSAYKDVGIMKESYVQDAGHGCVAKLDYDITWWSAFYMNLNHSNLNQSSQIAFSVRGDPNVGHPGQIKIELKRLCTKVADYNDCREISIAYVTVSPGEDYEYKVVNLSSFTGTGWPGYSPVTNWGDIEELVFVVESKGAPMQGTFYLDNIVFR